MIYKLHKRTFSKGWEFKVGYVSWRSVKERLRWAGCGPEGQLVADC